MLVSNGDVDKSFCFEKYESIENIAEWLLFSLGFKSNLQGTRFLAELIAKKYRNSFASLGKQMYPEIASEHHTKSQCVERSVRHAINECYAAGNLVRANEVFGCKVVDSKYPPTNSEFISAVCTWIHLQKGMANSSAQ